MAVAGEHGDRCMLRRGLGGRFGRGVGVNFGGCGIGLSRDGMLDCRSKVTAGMPGATDPDGVPSFLA